MVQMLSVLASLLILGTVGSYMWHVVRNGVTPNPTMFFVRSIVAVMNTVSYFIVVQHDPFKWLVTAVSAGALVFVFFYSLFCGKFTKMRGVDIICLVLAIIVGVVWKMTDGVMANLLLQGVMVLAFVPAAVGVYYNRAKEKPLPWALAVASYVLMTTIILIGWQGNWEALVHPLASGIGGNGALMLLAVRQHNWKWSSLIR
ncbi:MAG TPA: hypothetical protein VNK70_00950 [Candidatus Paceibacterota bacterium]|nr:hypothetical protein [Candidatus Paceibacterota bacterium]